MRSGGQTETTALLPNEFTGLCQIFSVPNRFEQLILCFKQMRMICSADKYTSHFKNIATELTTLLEMICHNYTGGEPEPDVRFRMNCLALSAYVDDISRTKKKHTQKFLSCVGTFHANRTALTEAFCMAIQEVGKSEVRDQNSFPSSSPSTLKQWIDTLTQVIHTDPWYHFVPHAFTYAPKTMITGTAVMAFFMGALTQSLFDYYETDVHLAPSKRSPAYVHYAMPLSFGLLGLLILTAGVVYTHKEKISEWWNPQNSIFPGDIETGGAGQVTRTTNPQEAFTKLKTAAAADPDHWKEKNTQQNNQYLKVIQSHIRSTDHETEMTAWLTEQGLSTEYYNGHGHS